MMELFVPDEKGNLPDFAGHKDGGRDTGTCTERTLDGTAKRVCGREPGRKSSPVRRNGRG